MNETDLHYPPESCPFCRIGDKFPFPGDKESQQGKQEQRQQQRQGKGGKGGNDDLTKAVPEDAECDPEITNPSSFVVLRSRDVLAFLDILPMTPGHLLVTARNHKVKVEDLEGRESQEIGFWLPILARTVSKVTGVTDYNIVQNNGARAAQVVPHVHFHIIPRPATMPEIKSKSWTMFGRGQRGDLDDEEGAKIAGEMRKVLRDEVSKMSNTAKL